MYQSMTFVFVFQTRLLSMPAFLSYEAAYSVYWQDIAQYDAPASCLQQSPVFPDVWTALQGVVTFDGLIITANSSMNTTGMYGLNYTITFSATSLAGIDSWDIPVNIR